MSLIKCRECGNMISDKAGFCPHCGLPGKYLTDRRESEDTVHSFVIDDAVMLELKNAVVSLESDAARLFSTDRYIAESEIKRLTDIYGEYTVLLKSTEGRDYLTTHAARLKINPGACNKFLTAYAELEEKSAEHNSKFIKKKLREYKEYFDGMLKEVDEDIRLDHDQRIAVLTDDDYCLLVAGAGAGKTTTMAAKTRYLVEKLHIDPREIIVISYTNKAIDELKERINNKLKIPAAINTFHSFAFDIVKKHTSAIPEVNFSSYKIIFELLEKEIYKDKKLLRNITLFMGYYFDLPENIFDYDNLDQYHIYKARQTYQTIKSSLNEYVKKVQQLRSKKTVTLTGEYLRSIQEVQIANFLYLNNIDYEYERIYEYPIQGAKKLYTPDFYISQGENTAYIEHYALSDNYTSAVFNKNQINKYKSAIETKRKLHRHYGTTLIETWSQYSDGRSHLRNLKEGLEKNGFILKEKDLKEVYEKITETSKDKYVVKFIFFLMKFIEHYKTNGYNEQGFKLLRKKTDNQRSLLFIDIAEKVYLYYQKQLKKRNQIDFADMINDANFYLEEIEAQNKTLPYRYIIIDEFQDIARQRFNLTKKLSDITNAKVVAVGDDWQSIFAFAGSDITLFTRFNNLMGGGRELKITRTYRNSQQLIDIAGGFIQKNSTQIRKKLISPKSAKRPIDIGVFEDSDKPMKNMAALITRFIGRIIQKYGRNSSILLIGRYNYDMTKLLNTNQFYQTDKGYFCKKYPDVKLDFLTAHSSKGLGYDNVILINMFEGRYGFPCQIEDDLIFKLVLHEDTNIPYAEERRLLYVALTRTKNKVFICAPKSKPSRFLIELIMDYEIPYPEGLNMERVEHFNLRCPVCNFPLKYEFNKTYGMNLWLCTNEPEICDFMTNSRNHRHDIKRCPECKDGYLLVKMNEGQEKPFLGCSNFENENMNCFYTESV